MIPEYKVCLSAPPSIRFQASALDPTTHSFLSFIMSLVLLSTLSFAAAQLSTSLEVVSDVVTYTSDSTTLTSTGSATRTHTYSTSTVVVCPSGSQSAATVSPTNTVTSEYTLTNQTQTKVDSATIVSPDTIVPISSTWTSVYTQPPVDPVQPVETTQSTIVPVNNGARPGAQLAVVAAAVLALL